MAITVSEDMVEETANPTTWRFTDTYFLANFPLKKINKK
jgi:hypothetical protein